MKTECDDFGTEEKRGLLSRGKAALEGLVEYGMYGLPRVAFMTPTFALSEMASGLDGEQSLKSRGLAAITHFLVSKPYNNWLKPKVEKALGVDENSSEFRKGVANRVAFAAHQIPVYSGILWAIGADFEQACVALPAGVAVGAATSGRFQKFMDGVSNFVDKGLYKVREGIDELKSLGKSYAGNLAMATVIATGMRVGINEVPKYVADNNTLTNRSEMVYVIEKGSDGLTYDIDREEFDSERHMLVNCEERDKVQEKKAGCVF